MSVASRSLWMTVKEKYCIGGLSADLNSSGSTGFQHVLHKLMHMGCVNCGEVFLRATLSSLIFTTGPGFDGACRCS